MNIRKIQVAASMAVLAGMLTGCGGRVDDTMPPPDNMPPASASASTDGFVAYAVKLTAASGDGSDVVDLSAFSLPSDGSDTAALVATPNDDPSGPT